MRGDRFTGGRGDDVRGVVVVSTSGGCGRCARRDGVHLRGLRCGMSAAGAPCPCGGDVRGAVAGYTCAGVVPLACLRGLAGCSWCAGGGGGVYLRRDGERMSAARPGLMVRPWWWVCRRRGRRCGAWCPPPAACSAVCLRGMSAAPCPCGDDVRGVVVVSAPGGMVSPS